MSVGFDGTLEVDVDDEVLTTAFDELSGTVIADAGVKGT
jgi:hypothetical protein